FGTQAQTQDLLPQANAEQRYFVLERDLARGDGVFAGFGIARAVGQENAVGFEVENILDRRLRRHQGNAAAAIGQKTQDIRFDAVVVSHNVVGGIGRL